MSADLSNKSILVIDDFSQMRSSLKKMVQAFGASDVDDAINGEDAVKKIARKSYDIVLCDYSLGDGKDGQQVLEEAKHRNLLKYSTIFMMITAENTSEMVMGAMEYSPDDYLTKPFTKEVLGKRLEKLIERKDNFNDIEAAIEKKKYDHAIALCDKHIEENPKNLLEFLRLKAELHIRTGEYESAESVYERILSMRDIPWAMLGLAKVNYYAQNYMKAQEILKDLIDLNSSYVEAYDLLAKCYQKLDAADNAKDCLARAAELSPKSILRQKALGEVAYKNKDYELAERSFSKVIRLGKNSIYKSAKDHTNLASVQIDNDSASMALKTIGNMYKEYKHDSNAELLGHAVEGIAYKKMGKENEAREALETANRLYEKMDGKVPLDTAMDMAKACLALGNKEQGNNLLKDIVRNHHDDDDVLGQVEDIFSDADLHEEGKKIISATRDEIVNINNKGVAMVKENKLKEAIDFFEKAADGLPDNKIINLNAAQAIIMFMEENGKDDKLLYQSRQYLDRVQKIDPTNPQYQKLLKKYKGLTS